MRCGSRLVDLGDSIYKVKELCGDPDQETVSFEYRRYRDSYRNACRTDPGGRTVCSRVYDSGIAQVPIHNLVYDFGRYRFVQYLRFESHRLVEVETGDYGVRTRPRPIR